MKVFCSLLFALPVLLFGQKDTSYRLQPIEIGVNMMGEIPPYFMNLESIGYFQGMLLRVKTGVVNYRFGFDRYEGSIQWTGNANFSSKQTENVMRFGVERVISRGKIFSIRLGTDVGISTGKFNNESSGGFTGITTKNVGESNGLKLFPHLSLEVSVNKHLSLSTETRVFITKDRYKGSFTQGATNQYKSYTSRTAFYAQMLSGLYLNLHF
jgi:hypothetical protein